MASYYKRGEYQWEVKIRRKGYPTQSKTFDTKAEAYAWGLQVESDMQRGTYIARNEADRTSMSELIERFIREVTPTHRGHVKEAARLRNVAKDNLWLTYVGNLRAADFAGWRDERLKAVSPATVVREMGDLSLILKHAMREWGIVLPVNPLNFVKRPRVANARSRRLAVGDAWPTRSEEEQLLAACSHVDGDLSSCRVKWLRPIVELAIETAMRRGEILRLEWQHLDLDRSVAYLPETKNGEPRYVPLTPRAVAILRAWPQGESHRVFDISENALRLAWQRAVKRSKLVDLRFHDLRHEAASRLAEKLSNVLELSSVTGHKDLRMLKRYYHPRAEDLAKRLAEPSPVDRLQ